MLTVVVHWDDDDYHDLYHCHDHGSHLGAVKYYVCFHSHDETGHDTHQIVSFARVVDCAHVLAAHCDDVAPASLQIKKIVLINRLQYNFTMKNL